MDMIAPYLQQIEQLSSKLVFEAQVLSVSQGYGARGESGKARTWSVPVGPVELQLSAELPADAVSPSRYDIDVNGSNPAFVIDGALTHAEADTIVALTERLGYSVLAPGGLGGALRRNKAVFWLANKALMDPLFARIHHLLPECCDGHQLYPALSHRLHMYKYEQGDEFRAHVDGQGPGGQSVCADGTVEHWPGQRSQYTMLAYLSGAEDGVQGGATRLYQFGRSGAFTDVSPRKGSLLFFRHGPSESVLHSGLPLGPGAPKYVIRSSLLFCD